MLMGKSIMGVSGKISTKLNARMLYTEGDMSNFTMTVDILVSWLTCVSCSGVKEDVNKFDVFMLQTQEVMSDFL